MINEGLILIIQNDQTKSKLKNVLSTAGFLALSVYDYELLLKTITQQMPILIICEEASENSLTVELCRRLRLTQSFKLPPICLCGDKISQSQQIHLKLETGAGDYFEMPIEPLQFVSTITKLIVENRSKDSLAQKDLLFRSLIENINDIISVITPDGYVLYESPSVERILGRPPIQTHGVNALDALHPEDQARVADYITNASFEDASAGVEYRIRHENGSWRIFHTVGRFNTSIYKTNTVLLNSRDVTAKNLLAERHHTALEKARMVWWEWNIKDDEIVTSGNFSEIYGIKQLKKIEDFISYIHPADFQYYRRLLNGVAKSGGSYHSQFRINRPDNHETIWLEETTSALLDERGRVERLVGISIDISERKKAEKDLRESEERFKALFKGIPVPVYIWEKIADENDFVLIDSNLAGEEQSVFSGIGLGIKASKIFKRKPEMIQSLRGCLSQRQTIHIQTDNEYLNSNDKQFLDLYFAAISTDLVMVISFDVTQQKTAEVERYKLAAQIDFQNQRLNNVMDSIPGAVWEVNLSQGAGSPQLDFVSEYIEKITGYPVERWISDPGFWFECIHPDDRLTAVKKWNEVRKCNGKISLEYRFLNKDKVFIWLETQMRGSGILNSDHVAITGINIDISERKNVEESLLKSEENMRQSQRLESVGRLAGGIAHDFNNMLTAINGYSELLLMELKEENSVRRKVLEIKKAGERSASLTQQLLAFSRRQILKPQQLDLNQVIEEMSDLLKRLIGEQNVLSVELSSNSCYVEADPGQLSQVIMNLVVNARDAMPNGGNILIKTERVYLDENFAADHSPTEVGSYIHLSVSDTGGGLEKDVMKYIFEPFYTTKAKGSGTGLGLATVYGIVKQSGGYIWVESEPQKGAAFNVYLPEIRKPRKIKKTEIEIQPVITGTETILLVEDEPAVRSLMVNILASYGYQILEAADGIDALEIFDQHAEKIDLLITDLIMPRMSGRELAEKINQINPKLPVLFSSGYSDDRSIYKKLPNKRVDFIHKPFKTETLGHKIRELLRSQ